MTEHWIRENSRKLLEAGDHISFDLSMCDSAPGRSTPAIHNLSDAEAEYVLAIARRKHESSSQSRGGPFTAADASAALTAASLQASRAAAIVADHAPTANDARSAYEGTLAARKVVMRDAWRR